MHATVNWANGKDMSIFSDFPDEEALHAVVLTSRLFFQENDDASISHLSKLLHDQGVSSSWKAKFREFQSVVDAFFDSEVAYQINGEELTYRSIHRIITYGLLAHSDEKYYTKCKAWMQNPIAWIAVLHSYHIGLVFLCRCVQSLAGACREEIGCK